MECWYLTGPRDDSQDLIPPENRNYLHGELYWENSGFEAVSTYNVPN